MLRYYVLIEVCNGEHVVVGIGNVNLSASQSIKTGLKTGFCHLAQGFLFASE